MRKRRQQTKFYRRVHKTLDYHKTFLVTSFTQSHIENHRKRNGENAFASFYSMWKLNLNIHKHTFICIYINEAPCGRNKCKGHASIRLEIYKLILENVSTVSFDVAYISSATYVRVYFYLSMCVFHVYQQQQNQKIDGKD